MSIDKQIIIDGVDVSGCKYIIDYNPPELQGTWGGAIHKGACRRHSGDCEHNPNCYYKQLKRKEQELEQVNKAYEECKNSRLKAYNKLQEKEQECEELKEKLENHCFDCDVAERMAKVTYAATGGRLSYSNYTVEAIEQAYNDQLRIDVEYRTKELEQQLDQLKAENDELKKWKKEHLKDVEFIERNPVIDILNSMADDILLEQQLDKLKQTLAEIKGIADAITNGYHFTNDIEGHLKELTKQILQKISEVIKDE